MYEMIIERNGEVYDVHGSFDTAVEVDNYVASNNWSDDDDIVVINTVTRNTFRVRH